jgi:hypothetical protein
MTTFRRWVLPLALMGGAATIGAFALQAKRKGSHRARHLHQHQMHAWEGEGGNFEPVGSSDAGPQLDGAARS